MLQRATILLTIFCLLTLAFTQAQNKASVINKTAKILSISGNEVNNISHPVINVKKTTYPDVVTEDLTFDFVGFGLLSGYDLQSNGTPDEIWQDPTTPDNLHAVFMNSQQTTVWTDRTITYFASYDGGLSWNNVINLPSSGEKSGYPSVNGFDDGTEMVALHSNAGGGLTRTEIFIDAGPGQGDFSMCDPGVVTGGEPIWARILGLGMTDYVFAASINGAPNDDAFINTGNTNCEFTGYVSYPGTQAETYSLAYDPASGKIGHLYLGNTPATGNLYYRESTDGTVTWTDPVEVWTYNPVDSMGTLRGCDLAMFAGQPYAVFEIDKVTGTSYFPAFPSEIYLWSPNVNGGTPMIIADSNSVPYGINYNSANDVTTPICRPTIGVSQGGSNGYEAIFVAFMAATNNYMGDPNGTANTYYAGYFEYSLDSGKTFTAPVKFTPDETPLRDWRYVSMSQINQITSDSLCTVHMVMQADTIPGSTVNNLDPLYPVAVSAELVGINTTVTIPQHIEVGVKDDNNKLYSFNLAQNYPNPFNPTTKISYSIPERSNVTLKVYNMLGQEVASLVNTTKDAGQYELNFNASQLSSGLYIYKIQAGNFTQSKKMMLLK